MAHFAILCRSDAGHVYPHTLIGRSLRERGHRITFINTRPELEAKAKQLDLEWYLLPPLVSQPPSKLEKIFDTLRWIAGGFLIRRFTGGNAALAYPRLFLSRVPAALNELAVDGIIADATCQSIGTVAEHLGLPYVSVSVLPSNWEPTVPPIYTTWPYVDTAWRRFRNRLAYYGWHLTYRPKLKLINRQRAVWNLPPYSSYNDAYSRLAQISQLVEEFDFPRPEAPDTLHYIGSLADGAVDEHIKFPWERLDDRPLVYVMLTTVSGTGRADTYRKITEACRDLDFQVVISIGLWLEGSEVGSDAITDSPGNPIVVNYAPQWSLIKRSNLVVCAGGVNTTMEALSNAVPVLAMPLAASQPGLAARLVRSGAGLMLPGRSATAGQIREAIKRLLDDSRFRQRAREVQKSLADAGGADRAAEIIELALLIGKPVPRNRGSD